MPLRTTLAAVVLVASAAARDPVWLRGKYLDFTLLGRRLRSIENGGYCAHAAHNQEIRDNSSPPTVLRANDFLAFSL